jgi:hypothetical protein
MERVAVEWGGVKLFVGIDPTGEAQDANRQIARTK